VIQAKSPQSLPDTAVFKPEVTSGPELTSVCNARTLIQSHNPGNQADDVGAHGSAHDEMAIHEDLWICKVKMVSAE